MRNLVKYHLPLILFAWLIFYISSLPRLPSIEIGFDYIDKLGHLIEFFIFTILAIRAFSHFPAELSRKWIYYCAIILSALYAISDEYHQSFVPGREADIYDILADTAGIILGVIAHLIFRKKKAVL